MTKAEAEAIIASVGSQIDSVAQTIPAGSYRRGCEFANDIDFVTILNENVEDEGFFKLCREKFGEPILGGNKGDRKAQYLYEGFLLDFYLCDRAKLEPMLLFLTGSAVLNIRMRAVAKKKKLSLNQYGLFDRLTGEPTGKQTEVGIFETLGMEYKFPHERSI
jgi:DNA polymerase/3'-5' exonuclease PolX